MDDATITCFNREYFSSPTRFLGLLLGDMITSSVPSPVAKYKMMDTFCGEGDWPGFSLWPEMRMLTGADMLPSSTAGVVCQTYSVRTS